MKRAFAVLGGALVVLLAVLVLRAALLSSSQVEAEPVALLEVDGASIGQRVALAVREQTISHQDEGQLDVEAFRSFHTLLRAGYPLTHRALELEKVSDLSLLYTWQGSNPELDPVLFAAHLDVVPVDPDSAAEWQHPPFEGVVADGVVWGRGTMDDKASVICLLEAVERLLTEGFVPERTVLLAFGHDEEVGGEAGAVAIAALLAERDTRLAWVLDEGGAVIQDFISQISSPLAVVGVAEKGYVSIGLSIDAPGGHSSAPLRHTAIGELAAAVVALESHPMPARLGGVTGLFLDSLAPELGFPARVVLANRWLFGPLLVAALSRSQAMDAMLRTTTAVTIFQSGVKENLLPVRADAVANFRIHPDDSIDSVVEHVRRTIGDDRIDLDVGVRSTPRPASIVSPVDSEAYLELSRTIRSVFPGTAVLPYLVIAGTDARHYDSLTDRVYRFGPFVYGPEILRLAHGTNERISVENLARAVQFFAERIRSGAGPQ